MEVILGYILGGFICGTITYIVLRTRYKLRHLESNFEVFDDGHDLIMFLGSVVWPLGLILVLSVGTVYSLYYLIIKLFASPVNKISDIAITLIRKRKNNKERPKQFMEM